MDSKPVSTTNESKTVAPPVKVDASPVAKDAAPKAAVIEPVAKAVVQQAVAPKSVAKKTAIKKTAIKTTVPKKAPVKKPRALATKTVASPNSTITKGKTIMNDTVNKVQETAQKMTADATARATEMFGDVSARAKTAMEKGSKGLEEMVEFSKGNLEAVVASGRVAAKGAQDIAKYSANYGRKSIEEANATAKKFAAVKSPTEFFALQSEVAKTQLDAFVGEASKFAEGYMKLLGEITQPIQNRYAVAVEKVKSAVAA